MLGSLFSICLFGFTFGFLSVCFLDRLGVWGLIKRKFRNYLIEKFNLEDE